MTDFIKSQLDNHTKDIDELRKKTSDIEKEQAASNVSIKYLSETIRDLTIAINTLSAEVKHITFQMEPIKRHIENNKGIGHFFKENWFRIPTMIVIFYGLIYAFVMSDTKLMAIKSII